MNTTPIDWQERVSQAHAARTRANLHKPMAAREDDDIASPEVWIANRGGPHRRYLGEDCTQVRDLIGDETLLAV